jgi:hypothetical protein
MYKPAQKNKMASSVRMEFHRFNGLKIDPHIGIIVKTPKPI